jgi:hypothetical protein
MITKENLDVIIKLINTRRDQVLEANNIKDEQDSVQHAWITGIYEDINLFLNLNLNQNAQ